MILWIEILIWSLIWTKGITCYTIIYISIPKSLGDHSEISLLRPFERSLIKKLTNAQQNPNILAETSPTLSNTPEVP